MLGRQLLGWGHPEQMGAFGACFWTATYQSRWTGQPNVPESGAGLKGDFGKSRSDAGSDFARSFHPQNDKRPTIVGRAFRHSSRAASRLGRRGDTDYQAQDMICKRGDDADQRSCLPKLQDSNG
jgi:hypothetical protein